MTFREAYKKMQDGKTGAYHGEKYRMAVSDEWQEVE